MDITNLIPMGLIQNEPFSVMENFSISIQLTDEVFDFLVFNKGIEKCEFEVYSAEVFGSRI